MKLYDKIIQFRLKQLKKQLKIIQEDIRYWELKKTLRGLDNEPKK